MRKIIISRGYKLCVGWREERTLRQRTREMVDRDRQNKCVRERD